MSRVSGTGSGYRPRRQMFLSLASAGQTEFGLQPFPTFKHCFCEAIDLLLWLAQLNRKANLHP
jgi:hypothetical protein